MPGDPSRSLVDQSVKDVLQPSQLRHHIEFWIPSETPRDIRAIPLPQPPLRELDKVPLFGWARSEEVRDWLSLASAKKSGDISQIQKLRMSIATAGPSAELLT